jgi:hypothetical protein
VSTERDVERIVRSWMDEGVTALPDRVLDLVLDQIPATPQRRAGWLARRYPTVNNPIRIAVAAVAVLAIAILGLNLLPKSGVGGPSATATPSPTASTVALAEGTFSSHGGDIQLDATGGGTNVAGTMTYADSGGAHLGGFVVDLACTRTTDRGLILIGGRVSDSTNAYVESAPVGKNVAIVLQPGSPVRAELSGEWDTSPHEPDCMTYLRSIPDLGDQAREPNALEPIDGTIDLGS